MSVAELASRATDAKGETTLSGWGRVAAATCSVVRPRDDAHVLEALASAAARSHGLIARGAGRSYGDAAQNDGGVVLDMTGWNRICALDRERKLITAQAGATVAQLLDALLPHDLTLPVLPGTRYVTLAGAIASDIHGKNHHSDGGLARFVTEIALCTPAHGLVDLSRDSDPELFYATLGGMGLTGVIVRATVQARELGSPWLAVHTQRSASLEHTLALMSGPEPHRYSVAWLDLLARGSRLGRGVVERGGDMPDRRTAGSRLPRPLGDRQRALSDARALTVPAGFPGLLLDRRAVSAFNALHWRAAPRRARVRRRALESYFFPLDRLAQWHRLYGSRGLIQYQFVVPDGREDVVVRCGELIAARRLPVFLAVFKRMGPRFGGPLSFPLAGWTLAIDLPARAQGLERALDELDELVAVAGGRVYLSKDVRLRPELLGDMYPDLQRFQAQCRRADPEGVLRSDLSRRLALSGVQR